MFSSLTTLVKLYMITRLLDLLSEIVKLISFLIQQQSLQSMKTEFTRHSYFGIFFFLSPCMLDKLRNEKKRLFLHGDLQIEDYILIVAMKHLEVCNIWVTCSLNA